MPDLLISYLRIQAYSEIQKALLTKDEVHNCYGMTWSDCQKSSRRRNWHKAG